MSDLLSQELLRDRPPIDADLLATAHRRAQATQGMLAIYLGLVVLSVVWYALMPTSPSLAPEIAVTVWFIATGIVFMRWTSAAYQLVPAFTGHPTERTPGWAIWGYIVPIASLWIPYQIVREISDAADPVAFDTGLGRFQSSPPIGLWWGVWVVWGILSQITSRIPEESYGTGDLSVPQVLAVIVMVLTLVVTVLAFQVVRRVDGDQQAVAALRANAQGE